jgi:hypothetical protein
MKAARHRVDVNIEELDRVLDGARQAPLSEADYEKLKDALHALAAMLVQPRNTEKTKAVLEDSKSTDVGAETQSDADAIPPPGHGRNGAEAFNAVPKIEIAHQTLQQGVSLRKSDDAQSAACKQTVASDCQPEQFVDKLQLREWVVFGHPSGSTLPDHVDRLDSL